MGFCYLITTSNSAVGAGRTARVVTRLQSLGMRRVMLSTVVVGLVSVLTGCVSGEPKSSFTEDTFAITPGHFNHDVGIGTGALGSSRWTLLASVNGEGQLCLGVLWMPASEPNDEGCGFGAGILNDEGRGYEPTATATSRDGSVLVYGPAPPGARTVTLSTPAIAGTNCTTHTLQPTTVTVDHVLPSWYPVAGRWFASGAAIKDPSCPISVTFRDKAGNVLAQRKNY